MPTFNLSYPSPNSIVVNNEWYDYEVCMKDLVDPENIKVKKKNGEILSDGLGNWTCKTYPISSEDGCQILLDWFKENEWFKFNDSGIKLVDAFCSWVCVAIPREYNKNLVLEDIMWNGKSWAKIIMAMMKEDEVMNSELGNR